MNGIIVMMSLDEASVNTFEYQDVKKNPLSYYTYKIKVEGMRFISGIPSHFRHPALIQCYE